MCGLYGIASSSFNDDDKTLFHSLGFLNCFRGIDSCGVIGVRRNGGKFKVSFLKKAVHPVTLLGSKLFGELSNEPNCFLVGHNRSATKGSIKDGNAHPFVVGNLIGMHNGTVGGLANEDTTDSEKLFEILAEKNLQAVVDAARFGAYALVWYDTQQKTLNFIRNEQRTLYFASFKGGVTAWSSEKRVFDFVGGATEIRVLPPNEHWEIKAGDSKVTFVCKVTPTPLISTFSKVSRSIRTALDCGYPYIKPSLAAKTKEIKADRKNKYYGYRGTEYAIKFIKKILGGGCNCCGCTTQTVQDKVHWIDHGEFICNDCKVHHTYDGNKKSSYEGKLVYAN